MSSSSASHPQGDFVQRIMSTMIKDIIDKVKLPKDGVVSIADLGCTLGPDTIANADAIINRMKRWGSPGKRPEQFKAYFQDSAGTDVCLLFRRISDENARDDDRPYSAVSVPGSLYGNGPLLPPSSIHFAISAFQLHRLSQVPPDILDKNSSVYNNELHDATLLTVTAYAKQAEADLNSFLSSRAQEMVQGGYLVLVFGICKKYSPSQNGSISQLQERMWDLLFSQGLVQQDTEMTYRRMIYYRNLDEATRVIRSRNEFRVVNVEEHPSLLGNHAKATTKEIMDSIMEDGESLLEAYFGKESTDRFLRENRRASNIAVIVLKRK